jgi:hypothetical protein
MEYIDPSYIYLLEENNRLQNEIDELNEYLNKESNFDLDKINDIIKTEISDHIKQYLVFDLDKINDIIKNEIKEHIKNNLFFDLDKIKENAKPNMSKYNFNKKMFFDVNKNNSITDDIDNLYNSTNKNLKNNSIIDDIISITDDTDTNNEIIKPIYDLTEINDIIKKEKMDLCVISHGGCCTNQLVDILTENGYNIKTHIWNIFLCHCSEYIDIDIPIIYIYGNPMNSFLSVKNRGNLLWTNNQRKLSNNINTKLSDENLLTLMIKQTNAWINIKKENVLILKSSEIFEEDIVDKLQSFLNKDLHSFPITYVKPKTSFENLNRDELLLFQKYKNDINKIIKKYLYDL